MGGGFTTGTKSIQYIQVLAIRKKYKVTEVRVRGTRRRKDGGMGGEEKRKERKRKKRSIGELFVHSVEKVKTVGCFSTLKFMSKNVCTTL